MAYQRVQRPHKPSVPHAPGHVYVIRLPDRDGGPRYKIGASINLWQRLGFLKGFYGGIDLVHSIATDDIATLETQLHAQYIERWIEREYFRLEESDLQRLRAM